MNFRKLFHIFTGLTLCLALGACTAPHDAQTSSLNSSAFSDVLVLQDDLGRSVEVRDPQRIAVLIGSFADLLNDAGGKERIVAAADDARSFDLDLNDAVSLGPVKSISQEALLGSKPDLVIASAKNDSQKKMQEMLEDAGIPVVYYDVSSFDDYQRVLRQMTQITGDEKAWQKHGPDQAKEMEEIISSITPSHQKVLILRETGKGIKALGESGSVLGEMCKELGLDNIAGEKGLDTLSMEYIHEENPDWIFYVAQGKDTDTAREMADRLFSGPEWEGLKALEEDHVHVLDQRLYNLKPNGKWSKALLDLKEIVYGS